MKTAQLAALAFATSLVACVHSRTQDTPRAVAATDSHIVVAGSVDTSKTGGIGFCGGGLSSVGPGVMFVSDDGGATFDRIEDVPGLTKLVARNDRFYGLTDETAGFAIVASEDGRTWNEVSPGDPARNAHDLVVASDGIYVPHATGYLSSPDGVSWTNHVVSSGWYNPMMASVNGKLVVATGDGTVNVLNADGGWTRTSPTSKVTQVAPLGNDVLVTGDSLIRIDLTTTVLQGRATIVQEVSHRGEVLVTPAGILEHDFGRLAPITATGIGEFASYGEPFIDGAVAGNRVLLIGTGGQLIVSNDGGSTFDSSFALPIVTIRD